MKSCPTCNRTYPDDTLAFCLMDGAVLSAPFDPEKPQGYGPPREPSPPRTEVMTAPASLPHTQAAREPTDSSTIASSLPIEPQSPIPPVAGTVASVQSNTWVWIVVVLVAVTVVILLLKFA